MRVLSALSADDTRVDVCNQSQRRCCGNGSVELSFRLGIRPLFADGGQKIRKRDSVLSVDVVAGFSRIAFFPVCLYRVSFFSTADAILVWVGTWTKPVDSDSRISSSANAFGGGFLCFSIGLACLLQHSSEVVD